MSNNNVDEFIIQLGFADKKAIDGFKKFVNKMEKDLAQSKKKIAKQDAAMQEAHSKNVMADIKKQLQDKKKASKIETQAYIENEKRKNAATQARLKQESTSQRRVAAERRQQISSERSQRAKISRFRTSANMDTIPDGDARKSGLLSRYSGAVKRGDVELQHDLERQVRRTARALREQKRSTVGLRAAQRGLTDSTRNMIRAYVSVFAIFEGASAINKTGQDFEALDSAMLAAMGTQELAEQQIGKLDKLTSRLGLSLVDTADQYTKFIFASKGKLPTEEVDLLFNNMAELGTVLGVSKDRMKLSFNAIQQMMNKNTISSEELKRQLAESMPGAIQLFAKAVGKSEAELFALMESGQLLAEDVLPKVAIEMGKVANESGALELKYKTTRVAQGRFFKELETAKNDIFEGGFGGSLAELFNEWADSLKSNEDALSGLSKIFSAFFKLLTVATKALVPIIESLLYSMGELSDALTWLFGQKSTLIIGGITGISLAIAKLGGVALTVNRIFSAMATKILLVIGLVDEYYSFFDDNRTNLLEKSLGKQINLKPDDVQTTISNLGSDLSNLTFGSVSGYVVNKIFIDGVEKSQDEHIKVQAESAMAGGRN